MAEHIDCIISAEIPDHTTVTNPALYNAVVSHMIHSADSTAHAVIPTPVARACRIPSALALLSKVFHARGKGNS
jgi:hypothetical protein